MPPLAIIVAMTPERVIGAGGGMPWHEPEDLAHFRRTTTGHAVIMGRRTWDSIGRPLPKRRNLVVSRQPGLALPGAEVFPDLPGAIAAARSGDREPFVIGGAQLYALALPLATRIHLTVIAMQAAGDAHFPELGAEWREVSRRDQGRLSFRELVRD